MRPRSTSIVRKGQEMTTMKYETPQMTALTSAINAIQATSHKGSFMYEDTFDPPNRPEAVGAYADWE